MKHSNPRRLIGRLLRLLLLTPLALLALRVWTAGEELGAPIQPIGVAENEATVLQWEELLPRGWDPAAGLRGRNVNAVSDNDPRAAQWLAELQESWSQAPTRPELAGRRVRLAGYVVPLDMGWGGMRDFLLVPYAGACIHTPPPPSNQVVHVTADEPVKGLKAMDQVWVGGRLSLRRLDAEAGSSSYHLEASHVAPYR